MEVSALIDFSHTHVLNVVMVTLVRTAVKVSSFSRVALIEQLIAYCSWQTAREKQSYSSPTVMFLTLNIHFNAEQKANQKIFVVFAVLRRSM